MLAAFVPIWALTAIGYATGRSRVLGVGAVDVLGRFVSYVAMPAALLDTLTRQPLTGPAGRGIAAFAAVPSALIALGLSLVRAEAPDAERQRTTEVALAVLLKSCVQPLACFLLARFVFGLAGPDLQAAVLCAALPTAQNTFVFARAYGVDGGYARDVIMASTALSMVTLTVAATLLQ